MNRIPKVICILVVLIHLITDSSAKQSYKLTHDTGRFQVIALDGRNLVCYDTLSGVRPNALNSSDAICLESLPYFEKGCDRGIAKACTNMGYLYRLSPSVGIDENLADAIFREGCILGGIEACIKLTKKQFDTLNRNEIFNLIASKCSADQRIGCVDYAQALVSQRFEKLNLPLSTKILEKECDAGIAKACYHRAYIFDPKAESETIWKMKMDRLEGNCLPQIHEVCRLALAKIFSTLPVLDKVSLAERKSSYLTAQEIDARHHVLDKKYEEAINLFINNRTDELKTSLMLKSIMEIGLDDSQLEQAIEQFVLAHPKSFVPFLYRAAFYLSQSKTKKRNGPRNTSKATISKNDNTPEDLKKSQKALLKSIAKDLKQSLQLERDNVHASVMLLDVEAMQQFNIKKIRKKFRKLHKKHPNSFVVLEYVYQSRNTRWGTLRNEIEKVYQDTVKSNSLVKSKTASAVKDPRYHREQKMGYHTPLTFFIKYPYWYKNRIIKLFRSANWNEACSLSKQFLQHFPYENKAYEFDARCGQYLDRIKV